jgi:hypothetical protein
VTFRTRICDLLGIELPIIGAATAKIATVRQSFPDSRRRPKPQGRRRWRGW